METMTIKVFHFFPDLLNLYGDRGNVLAMKYRAEQRGIKLEIVEVSDVSQVNLKEADIFFIGGGADSAQSLCTEQLLTIKDQFKELIEDGIPALTICGGYQFLGKKYITADGQELKTLGILDFYTESKADAPRLIGNVLLESDKFGRLVGFENHGGRTYHNFGSLGKVVKGFGNNGEDMKEGLVYKNLIGTYLHGPILPKNPTVTDFLLETAIERKYGKISFANIETEFEDRAKEAVWELYR